MTDRGEFYEGSELPRTVKTPTEQSVVEDGLVDESGGGGAGGAIGTVMRRSAHPFVALFSLGFKAAAIVAYLFLGIFLHNFVVQFVVTVTLLAFDFWTTKNVSGRLLVGLRWWTDAKEDGSTSWRFECTEDTEAVNGFDYRIFWWSLYIFPLSWVGLGLVAILRLQFRWLLVIVIALVLTMTNVYAYFKCSRQQQEQISSYMTSTFLNRAMSYFTGVSSSDT